MRVQEVGQRLDTTPPQRRACRSVSTEAFRLTNGHTPRLHSRPRGRELLARNVLD